MFVVVVVVVVVDVVVVVVVVVFFFFLLRFFFFFFFFYILTFESLEKTIASAVILCNAVCVSDTNYKQGRYMWQKYQTRHELAFSLSLPTLSLYPIRPLSLSFYGGGGGGELGGEYFALHQ